MSLSHILQPEPQEAAPAPDPPAPASEANAAESQLPSMAPKKKVVLEEPAAADTPKTEPADGEEQTSPNHGPMYTSTTTSTRRNASGSVSSVYSGNKIRHLKKDDGIPLWRKDIQYDFLNAVFFDKTQCFTKYSDGTKNHTFAEVYIDAMAKSSKCSKILKEKLLQDTDGAICMAMVCLLVNVGRMNTTLNFFPEMRAQLRTYHSIPALQAHQDPYAYKQLQDAPRLKSILKGATEDEPQPGTIEEIKAATIPRTNPVNLIFVISQYAPKISDVHFPIPRDFFDLIIRSSLSSRSRARAFLWLMWWYLESDFGYDDSQRNPFGKGIYAEGDQDTGVLPLKVPALESLNEEQAAQENVDTEDEVHFGEVKRKERIAILASEPSPAMTALKRARKEKGLTSGGPHGMQSEDEASEVGWSRAQALGRGTGRNLETGSEYTRSPSPRNYPKHGGDMRINNLLNNDDAMSEASPPHAAIAIKKGPGRGNWRRNKLKDPSDPRAIRPQDERSHHVPLLPNTGQLNFVNEAPQPLHPSPSGYHSTLLSSSMGSYKPTMSYQSAKRGMTQHQSAVMNHRAQQINYTLDRRIRRVHYQARGQRQAEGSMLRAWKRIRIMPIDYDSEEEKIKVRKAKERLDKDDDWRINKGKENTEFYADADSGHRSRVYMAGLMRVTGETGDVGEEAKSIARSFDRCRRRLKRWEDALPGDAMIKRRTLQAQGLTHPPRRRRALANEPSMEQDGLEIMGNSYGSRSRGRSGHGVDKIDVDPDDEDGVGELDEDERELLGEVDAGESEDDEDEDMGDD